MLSLLLHLVLVGAGPVVDLRLETAECAAHGALLPTEDGDDAPCDSGHDHDDCLIRALLAMDVPAEGAAPVLAPPVHPRRPVPALPLAPTASPTVRSHGARAPPAF